MPATKPDLEIELPFPPTQNHYWGRKGNRSYVNAVGWKFRRNVEAAVIEKRWNTLTCKLSVEVALHPPDRRRRDIDNVLKALLDALQYAGAYADDSQIDKLCIARGHIVEGGACVVRIWEVEA